MKTDNKRRIIYLVYFFTFNVFNLVNACAQDLSECLIKAAKDGDVDTINTLLGYKANPEMCERLGNHDKPLHKAAKYNRAGAIKALVEGKADINSGDTSGNTPLLRATYTKATDAITMLLALKADPTIKNIDGTIFDATAPNLRKYILQQASTPASFDSVIEIKLETSQDDPAA